MMRRLGDDPSQPHVSEVRGGDAVVGRTLRWTPVAAEQRSGKGQSEQFVEPCTWLSARRGSGIGVLRNLAWRPLFAGAGPQFHKNECAKYQASGKQQVSHEAIDHG